MTRGLWIALVCGGSVAAVQVLPAFGAQSDAPGCRTAGSVVIKTAAVRVTRSRRPGGPYEYRLCYRPTGKVTSLGPNPCGHIGDECQLGAVVAAGKVVAFAKYIYTVPTSGSVKASIRVFDASEGRTTQHLAALAATEGVPSEPVSVLRIALSSRGRVAWIVRDPYLTGGPVLEVRAAMGGQTRTLDTGPAIDPHTLTIVGTTVRWRNGGQPKCAALR